MSALTHPDAVVPSSVAAGLSMSSTRSSLFASGDGQGDFRDLLAGAVERTATAGLRQIESAVAIRQRLVQEFGETLGRGFDGVLGSFTEQRFRQTLLDLMDRFSLDDPQRAAETVVSLASVQMRVEQFAAQVLTGARSPAAGFGAINAFNVADATARMTSLRINISLETIQAETGRVDAGQMARLVVQSQSIEVSAFFSMFDPLVLDLNGDGIRLRAAEDGVNFDLLGDGQARQTAFVQADDALLFLDRDGDGRLTDGRELFGDLHGHAHGFAHLSDYDTNHDGRIDRLDPVYQELRLFVDDDGNGRASAAESHTLAECGVEAIDLGCRDIDETDASGNRFTQTSRARMADGSSREIADAWFRYR